MTLTLGKLDPASSSFHSQVEGISMCPENACDLGVISGYRQEMIVEPKRSSSEEIIKRIILTKAKGDVAGNCKPAYFFEDLPNCFRGDWPAIVLLGDESLYNVSELSHVARPVV